MVNLNSSVFEIAAVLWHRLADFPRAGASVYFVAKCRKKGTQDCAATL
jgi:hypothetical protein